MSYHYCFPFESGECQDKKISQLRQCRYQRQNSVKIDAKPQKKIPLSYLNKSRPGLFKNYYIELPFSTTTFYFIFFGCDRQNSSTENAESSLSCLKTATFLKNCCDRFFNVSQKLHLHRCFKKYT